MGRSRLVWLLCLPVAAIGGLAAHLAVYFLLTTPSGHARHGSHVHDAATGQASGWPHLRACIAICAALILLSLAAAGAHALLSGGRMRVPVWVFALLPPLTFSVQEQLEALIGAAGHGEGAFVIGLLLQVPFAALAYLLAKTLLSAVRALVRGARTALPRLASFTHTWLPGAIRDAVRPSVLGLGHGQRAPPLLSS